MTITVTIPGEPVGKGRPKFTKTGTAYTPPKTRTYENKVAFLYKVAAKGRKFQRHVPVAVEIRAYYEIPQSDSKRQRERKLSGTIMPCKKPDIDNVVKAVLDAINGIAYEDDAQVVMISASKAYSERPRVDMCVSDVMREENKNAGNNL